MPETRGAKPNQLADPAMVLSLIEALKDQDVLNTLRDHIVPLNKISEIVKQEVAALQRSFEEKLEIKDKVIGVMQSKIKALEGTMDELEQYGRRQNLRIHGIPESANESTDEMILSLANDKMKVVPPLKLEEIQRSHRVGKSLPQNQGKPRPILVRFGGYRSRAKLGQRECRARLRGSGVYLSEDLTRQRATLAWQARKAKRDGHILDTWVHDGKVLSKNKNGLVTVFTARE